MPRPIEALIHTDALVHNLQQVRCRAPDALIWSIVKANAYGHGLEHIYPALGQTDGFALLEIEEAQRLRQLGWRGPILLLEGVFDARELEACSRLHLWHVIHSPHQIDWLSRHKTQEPHQVVLKINTGMNRLGFEPSAFRAAYARLSAMPQVAEVTAMTHFSDADAAQGITQQLQCFSTALAGLNTDTHSLANSATILQHAAATAPWNDWVRAGIMLYGAAPDAPLHTAAHWNLQPAMTLRSQIIATQQLAVGTTIGYGSTYTATQPMRIGIVACGYADGYPRHCGTGTPILIDGIRTQTLGRVSMDMLAADLTPIPQAGVGSTATLWGHGPHHSTLPIEEVAQAAHTIAYELMCAVAHRVPRKPFPHQPE
jgi:alanine racemase